VHLPVHARAEPALLIIPDRDPRDLASIVVARIRDGKDPAGRDIETWEIDKKGYLRHTKDRWNKAGAFELVIGQKTLRLRWMGGPAAARQADSYEILHGMLLSLLVTHFGDLCSSILFKDRRPDQD
jgi:hypothetical protein